MFPLPRPASLLLAVLLILLTLATPAAALPIPNTTAPTADPVAADVAIQINEVMFHPASTSEWVELKNVGSSALNIRGYALTDEDGNWYRIPDALPDVPAGALVLILFDGQGSNNNEYNFGDNVATLHSPPGMVNIFEDDADQVALYPGSGAVNHIVFLPLTANHYIPGNPHVPDPNPTLPSSDLVDFVAWGAAPGADGAEATLAGRWDAEWYVSLHRGLGEASEEVALAAGESIGLLPVTQAMPEPDDWFIFRSAEVSQGTENPRATISWYYPDPGATLDSETFAVSWAPVPNATGYRFQLDDDAAFGSPYADLTLAEPSYMPGTPVPDGAYFWRVKTLYPSGESAWSTEASVTSLTLPSPVGTGRVVGGISAKVLGITWQLQHKDTKMLCLDGDVETGDHAWNAPHVTRGIHGRNYCARASVAMIASYYGGRLSQDRITYETFKGGAPTGDLGHDVPYTGAQAQAALSWALGQNVPPVNGKPTFAQIKQWIDADRPMRAIIPGHSRAIDGYLEYTLSGTTYQFLHVLDPWDQAKWVSYASDNIIYVQVGPGGSGGAPGVRSDEDVDGDNVPDTMDDSDNDGVVDFDERNRFGTQFNNDDSDADRVPDGADIREYIFTNSGGYAPIAADIDGDGKRKELDKDNDNVLDDGNIDGCEDRDRDGKYEPSQGESFNWNPADDMTLHVRLTWPKVNTDVDIHLVKPGGSYGGAGDVYYANTNPDWGELGLPCDDPRLDVDCIYGCTIENIRLATLENGSYSIIVHYYSDHDLGPTSPTVTVWLRGVSTTYGPRTLSDDQVWNVATVQWPTGRLVAEDSVEVAPPAARTSKPTK